MAVATEQLVRKIVNMLASARRDGVVPLHRPLIGDAECAYVRDCLATGWVSSVGAYVDQFERMLAERFGVGHAVAVNTGTAALHAALLAAGVAPGDEVLTTPLTFVATANAIDYCGAVPHFVDVEEQSMGIDPDRLGAYLERTAVQQDGRTVNRYTGRPMTALLPVHVLGCPCQIRELAAVAERFGLRLIEDAAEAIGSTVAGKPVGGFGLAGTVSFNGNKLITTGGGGAVLTDDPAMAQRVRHLTTTAKPAHRWRYDHDQVGYNYRMPNINAAIGCGQLEHLDDWLADKRRLHERYANVLAEVSGVHLFEPEASVRSNHWLNAIVLDAPDAGWCGRILEQLHDAGVLARPLWTLMHRLPMYGECPRDNLPVAELLADRVICLPSSVGL